MDGVHIIGILRDRQIARTDREGDVVFRLGEPLQKLHRSLDLILGAGGHDHTGTLLHGHILAVGKLRALQHLHADIVAHAVVGGHLRREEGGAGAGADIAQHIAGLDVIAAEASACGKPALDKGHIVVIPQFAGHIVVKVDGHLAVLHFKNGVAKLLCTYQHIVGHGVAAEQSLAVIGGIGLSVGPVVVFACRFHQTFQRGKVVVACAGSIGKDLPVGVIEEHQLGGFCHWEDLDLAAAVKVALRQVAIDERIALCIAQVGRKVHQHSHLVHGVSGIRIGRENVGQFRCTHLALGGIHHTGFQIVDTAQTLGGHRNAFFCADGAVELVHQFGKAFHLVAIVIGPDCNVGHSGLLRAAAAAGSTAQHQRRCTQQTDAFFENFLHKDSPQPATADPFR